MALDRPILPRSLVDEAFERIADAIMVGEIEAGARIREAYLARQLGISRGVLREAMQRLEGLKLVSRTSNIGVHVAALSQQDLFELFTMREALEGMAARLAAVHMTDDEIAALRELVERQGRNPDVIAGDSYYQGFADEDFHTFIARRTRNTRLERMICNELNFQLRLYRYRSSGLAGRAQAAHAEHVAIVEAIAARDPERAEQAMRTHLQNGRANLRWTAEARVISGEKGAAGERPAKPAMAKLARAG